MVSAAAAPVTPGDDGSPSVVTLEPASASRASLAAVIAARRLGRSWLAGEPPGQPDGAHGGPGAADQAQQLDRGHLGDDLGGQFGLARRRRPERQPVARRPPHRSTTAGCAWPRIIGPRSTPGRRGRLPSASVSQYPLPEGDEPGRTPDRAEGPHRRVHPPGITPHASANSFADKPRRCARLDSADSWPAVSQRRRARNRGAADVALRTGSARNRVVSDVGRALEVALHHLAEFGAVGVELWGRAGPAGSRWP